MSWWSSAWAFANDIVGISHEAVSGTDDLETVVDALDDSMASSLDELSTVELDGSPEVEIEDVTDVGCC